MVVLAIRLQGVEHGYRADAEHAFHSVQDTESILNTLVNPLRY